MVRQFCKVCKKELGMKVVTKDTGEDFIWCQCPECKGIAPYHKQLKGRGVGFRKGILPKGKERASIRKKNVRGASGK